LLFGAELQNLLKLFEALIDGQLYKPLTIVASSRKYEKIIY
jgi:hypothetical protein